MGDKLSKFLFVEDLEISLCNACKKGDINDIERIFNVCNGRKHQFILHGIALTIQNNQLNALRYICSVPIDKTKYIAVCKREKLIQALSKNKNNDIINYICFGDIGTISDYHCNFTNFIDDIFFRCCSKWNRIDIAKKLIRHPKVMSKNFYLIVKEFGGVYGTYEDADIIKLLLDDGRIDSLDDDNHFALKKLICHTYTNDKNNVIQYYLDWYAKDEKRFSKLEKDFPSFIIRNKHWEKKIDSFIKMKLSSQTNTLT